MKAIIVNCFDTYESRVDIIYDFFNSKKYDVTIIQSDFRHFKKIKRIDDKKPGYHFIETKPYYKNLSVKRLLSHYDFAKKAFEYVECLKPDLLYVLIPPNSLVMYASKYKRENKNVKLIFDLIDLWPETLPFGKVKKFPPLTFWRKIRDNNLKYADFIITECNLYQDVLRDTLRGLKTNTIYLAKKDKKNMSHPILNDDMINLCYLGSINNIIDISKIKKLIELLNKKKPVTLHIIGDGENKDLLIDQIRSTGAKVKYYGKIYDERKKCEIFDICHFGLNIMKDNVCVGLTMKSIDYFHAGLPILNNIRADTEKLVREYNAGINLDSNISDTVHKVLNLNKKDLLKMRKNTILMFEKNFSIDVFNNKLNTIITELNT